jgi:hypothetical protein
VARHLHIQTATVRLWISKKELSVVNIAAKRGRPCYRIYRDDLWLFLSSRGMTEARFQQIFSYWFPPNGKTSVDRRDTS